MSDDFFGDLGKHISKYTKRAADSTGAFIESTKLSTQIGSEERAIEKLYRELGEETYKLASAGKIELDADRRFKADSVTAHRKKIREMKDQLAKVRGMKVCPHCGEVIDRDVSFCPKCGAPIEENRKQENEAKEAAASEETGDDGAVDAAYEKVDADAGETGAADASFEKVQEEARETDSADAEFVTVPDETGEEKTAETEEVSMDADFTVIEDRPDEADGK